MTSERLWKAVQAAGGVAVKDSLWYVLAAGLLWLGFHFVFRRAMARRKLVGGEASRSQVRAEVARSLRNILVFAAVTGAVVFAALGGHTRMYARVDEHGWAWFFASVAVAVVAHDAYFYWTHRLMHHRWLFRRVHLTHHLSTNPTPWAAYSFGVAEAFVQAGIGPLLVFTVPMHAAAFLAFMTWQVTFNVLGHCGHEIFPRCFLDTPLGKVLNTVTHHAQHHEKFRGNYGLYFNVWDRLMGTNHPDYEARFAGATGGPDGPELAPTTAPKA
jgi:sterol desaturase/sphingolipid hydroxylase (fatty acid hydroxylase superfamily)